MTIAFSRSPWMVPLVTIAVIAADQLSKWAMLAVVFTRRPPPVIITDFFSLVLVWNHGVSFGMFNRPDISAAAPYGILAVTAIIIGLLAVMARRTEKPLERLGYALTIGGAVGNVIDRLRFGAVADFFYFHLGNLGWPAFNIADSLICIGVFILLIAAARNSTVAP